MLKTDINFGFLVAIVAAPAQAGLRSKAPVGSKRM